MFSFEGFIRKPPGGEISTVLIANSTGNKGKGRRLQWKKSERDTSWNLNDITDRQPLVKSNKRIKEVPYKSRCCSKDTMSSPSASVEMVSRVQ